MHGSVLDWLTETVPTLGLPDAPAVLEVGSLDVNGSPRGVFAAIGADYRGVDFRAGPGVDAVMNAHDLDFPDGAFDAVVCTEMLEHDDAFWTSMAEMGRVLAQGGALLLSTRGNGFPEHDYPHDLWRFMPQSAGVLMALAGCELVSYHSDPEAPGILVVGRRA